MQDTNGVWTAYGGIQGPNYSTVCTSGSGPCNTCTGTNGATDGACNPAGVFANTPITFTGTTTVTAATAKWLLCNGATEFVTGSTNLQTSLTTTWGDICNADDLADSTCNGAMDTTTLYFGAGTDCNNLGTEKVSIKFLSRPVDITASSNYIDCPPPTVGTGYGACYFSLFPGDEKVYLETETFSANSNFPAVDGGPSGITTDNIYFFFVEVDEAGGEVDNVAYARITNNTDSTFSTSLPVSGNATEGFELEGSIDDLTNDARYCFRMASQDTAKNIEYFTPTTACVAATCDNVCMTPSEVVGLLTDKKCFIATAAFGSDMDQHVQMLREFRNKFMTPYWLGRKLVKAYYSISPTLARWISEHEEAKTITRWVLWPVISWAQLALKYGWTVLVTPFLLLILGFKFARSRRKELSKA